MFRANTNSKSSERERDPRSKGGSRGGGGSGRSSSTPPLTGKFVIITGFIMVVLMFGLGKVFDLMPVISHNTVLMAGVVILAFAWGWLACLINDIYIAPLIMERNQRAALRELGLDHHRRRRPLRDEDEDEANH